MSGGYFKAIIAADAEKSSLSSAATNNYSNCFIFVYLFIFFRPKHCHLLRHFLNIMTKPRLEFRQPKYSVIFLFFSPCRAAQISKCFIHNVVKTSRNGKMFKGGIGKGAGGLAGLDKKGVRGNLGKKEQR